MLSPDVHTFPASLLSLLSTCLSESQFSRKCLRTLTDRLYQCITGRAVKLLHAIDQVKGRELSIITKEQLGPLPPVVIRPPTISELDGRVVHRLQLERPVPRQAPREQVPAHPGELLAPLGNVDHPVAQYMPVATLVAPQERVLGPVVAVVGRVPWHGLDEVVRAGEGVARVDLVVLGAEYHLMRWILWGPQRPRCWIGPVDQHLWGRPGPTNIRCA